MKTKTVTQTFVCHVGVLVEYEHGWGSKEFLAKAFDTEKEALDWCSDQNKSNTESSAPDYYIVAQYREKMDKEYF